MVVGVVLLGVEWCPLRSWVQELWSWELGRGVAPPTPQPSIISQGAASCQVFLEKYFFFFFFYYIPPFIISRFGGVCQVFFKNFFKKIFHFSIDFWNEVWYNYYRNKEKGKEKMVVGKAYAFPP